MKKALKKSVTSLIYMFPMIMSIIALMGIFQTYIKATNLSFLFGKNNFIDTITGTFIGAISVGHGLLSYIMGDTFLKHGVSKYGVASFIIAWVSLGFVQIPFEASFFGIKFTIYRNILTFISTIVIVYLTFLTISFIR